MTALSQKPPHRRFVEPTGHSLRLSVPQAELPVSELEWHVPERWGALEHNRAQAYTLAYAVLVTYDNVLLGLNLMRKSGPDRGVSTPYKIPKDAHREPGLRGGVRGHLTHHMAIENQVIENYQIVGPSTFTMSPRDASGTPVPARPPSWPSRC